MLKPYDEYKNVGEVWVDKTPMHWDFKRIKHVFYNRVEKNSPIKTECILSLSAKNGVELQTAKTDKGGNKPKSDLSKYNIAIEQDLLVNCMNVVSGSSGVSKWYGAISPVYYALHTRNQYSNIQYYHYLFRFKPFYRSLLRFSKGILMHESDNGNLNTVRMRISMESLNNINIPIPPREEQDQIVKYLDWQTSKINTLIKAKKKQIELLKEQKQAIINQAVTKGLDDTVPMKDSGIEWLGDMPDGWYIRPFHKVATVKSNLVHPNDFQDFIQVSPANIEKDTGKLLNCGTVKEAGIISDNHYFYEGQILYSKIRPLLNKVTIAPCNGLCSADMYPIETILETKYLVFYMLSKIYLSQISMSGNRVKMPKINKEELSTVLILFPDTKQQQVIVTYLEEKTALIDKAIAVIEKEIELVSEYKTSLISSVVTGKVDVRDVVVPEFEVVDDEVSKDDEGLEVDMDERI